MLLFKPVLIIRCLDIAYDTVITLKRNHAAAVGSTHAYAAHTHAAKLRMLPPIFKLDNIILFNNPLYLVVNVFSAFLTNALIPIQVCVN